MNCSHLDDSDACSFSHFFCLARNALWMADYLGVGSVDEHAVDVCGVCTVSKEAIVGAWSVNSMSLNGSGNDGTSTRAVKICYDILCQHTQRNSIPSSGTSPLSLKSPRTDGAYCLS